MEKFLDVEVTQANSTFNSIQFNSLAKNSRGFSIVEVLVAIGIMSIIGLGMATMIANQNKEAGALDEKMALQSLQTQIMNVLSSPTFCGWIRIFFK